MKSISKVGAWRVTLHGQVKETRTTVDDLIGAVDDVHDGLSTSRQTVLYSKTARFEIFDYSSPDTEQNATTTHGKGQPSISKTNT